MWGWAMLTLVLFAFRALGGRLLGSNLSRFLHQGYGKSRSLSSIDGVAGSTVGLAPLTSHCSSPCPLRRPCSPVPSIL